MFGSNAVESDFGFVKLRLLRADEGAVALDFALLLDVLVGDVREVGVVSSAFFFDFLEKNEFISVARISGMCLIHPVFLLLLLLLLRPLRIINCSESRCLRIFWHCTLDEVDVVCCLLLLFLPDDSHYNL